MNSDFTKAFFGPLRRFVGVLMQQGRVTLDSDAPTSNPDVSRPSPAPDADTHVATNSTPHRKPD